MSFKRGELNVASLRRRRIKVAVDAVAYLIQETAERILDFGVGITLT